MVEKSTRDPDGSKTIKAREALIQFDREKILAYPWKKSEFNDEIANDKNQIVQRFFLY